MSRRAWGDGSVFRRKDWRWQASLQINGVRRVVYGKTKADATKKLAELKRQASGGVLPNPGKRTLAQLLSEWLAAADLKPTTRSHYQLVLKAYVMRDLGDVRLSKLEPSMLQRLYAKLSPSVADRVHRILHRAFSVAVLWNWMNENPCDRVVKPKYNARRRELWDHWQLNAFLKNTERHWLWPLWVTVVATGCRISELLALTWQDVDMAGCTITINKIIQRTDKQWTVLEPKTKSSRRTISVPQECVVALKKQKAQQAAWRLRAGSKWQDIVPGLVFTCLKGQPLHRSVVCHALQRECKKLGLPVLTIHQLRHLHASLLLAQGLPIPLVAARLGHANPSVTMKIYAHAVDRQDELAAQTISRVLTAT